MNPDLEVVKPTGRVLAQGVLWTGAFRWSAQIFGWAATLVVIRLLSPEDYGIAGLALATLVVATALSEFGLGTALVALPEVSIAQVAQLNTAALLLAAVVGGSLALMAPLIAQFYGQPALRNVLSALTLVFLAEGARLVPQAMLARRLQYRTMALLDFARAMLTAAAVLVLAIAGKGYWALIIGNIAGVSLTTGWVLFKYGQPFAWPRPVDLREAMRYSRHVLVSRLTWTMFKNADLLVVGRMFGTGPLGYYTVATTITTLPGEKLGNVLTATTAPFFSAIQGDRAALRAYFLRVTELLALVLYPLLLGFLCVVDLAIALVLGAQWLPAMPIVVILISYAVLQNVLTPLGQILNVTGHTRTSMRASVYSLLVLVPGFMLAGHLGGINGVAAVWILASPLVVGYPLSVALRALSLRPIDLVRCGRFAGEGVLVMAVVVGAVRTLPWPSEPSVAELSASIIGGAVAYGGTLWFRRREFLLIIGRVIADAMGRRK